MLTDDNKEDQRAFESPITDEHRRRLLAETEEWYADWANEEERRYELVYDDNSTRPWQLKPKSEDEAPPSIEQWLDEYTGERSSAFLDRSEFETYGDSIHLCAQAIVWEAFQEKFGDDWSDDDDLYDAQCLAEEELYGWLTEALKKREEKEHHQWQEEGF